MIEAIGPAITIANTLVHLKRSAAIERFIRHAPETVGHEQVGPCPVCGVGEMRVRRDGAHYLALCGNGCGQASTMR